MGARGGRRRVFLPGGEGGVRGCLLAEGRGSGGWWCRRGVAGIGRMEEGWDGGQFRLWGRDISSRERGSFRRISRPGNKRPEYGSALAMRFCCVGGAGRGGRPWGPGRIRPRRGWIYRCFRG